MFDVSWTDPTRETVGERKSRKESKDRHEGNASKCISSSGSSTTSGSQSSNRPSFLGLFGGQIGTNGESKKFMKRSDSHSKLSTLRTAENTERQSRRISSYTIKSNLSESDSTPTSPPPLTNFFDVEPFLQPRSPNHFAAEHSSTFDGDVAESIFSGRTGRSGKTESTWSSLMDTPRTQQKLHRSASTNSFVTQYTDITVSPRASVKIDEQLARLVSISPPPLPILVRETTKERAILAESIDRQSSLSTSESIGLPSSPLLQDANVLDSWPVPPSARHSARRDSPEFWKCSNATEIPGNPPPIMLGPPLVPVKSLRRKPPPLELTHLQRSIRRMGVASSAIVLEHLREDWLHVSDASMYREMEVEKQLWLLTALEHSKRRHVGGRVEQVSQIGSVENPPTIKLLSLYENQASASFLSAMHPIPRIHHISTSPLSPSFFPNVHPLAVPAPTTQLPYASNLFNSIHAFCLPSILPASAIPDMLKECHRTLRSTRPPPAALPYSLRPSSPSSPISLSSTRTVIPPRCKERQQPGAIHLTIIDPAPLPDTLGPKLRTWLETHLIVNLERHFKCVNPSRLFPIWLADAGLRGEGSTIVSIKFSAVTNVQDLHTSIKEELKSMIGRTLWREIWGLSVVGDNWWWEDEGIVEECTRMGTTWEWSAIEGVKQG